MSNSTETYIDRRIFFKQYRNMLDQYLTQAEVNAISDFLDLLEDDDRIPTVQEKAYVLATVFHETNQTFEPVKEAYWLSENWRKKNLRYYPWYGRGFVQLTWEANYRKMTKKLGVDLITNPDNAMEFDIAYNILVVGMVDGDFTGKKLSDYWEDHPLGGYDYARARQIVNGTDKMHKIAAYAFHFEDILEKSMKVAVADPAPEPEPDGPEESIWAKLIAAIRGMFS